MNTNVLLRQPLSLFLAVGLALVMGLCKSTVIFALADGITKLFVNMLALLSVPLIFLSIVSTISGMSSLEEMKTIGKRVLGYTLLTTIISASIGLLLFVLLKPVEQVDIVAATVKGTGSLNTYFSFLLSIVPSNIVALFGNNANVAGIVFFALLFSVAILKIPEDQKKFLHQLYESLFSVVLKITSFVLYLMPIGVWAFVTQFINSIDTDVTDFKNLALYFVCIVTANLIQGFVVLPLLLWFKGISPLKTFKGVSQALTVAFFSKSSNTALPLTISNTKDNLGVSDRVASFSLPLCSTINMNGCAAFILVTVLFVAMSNGYSFSLLEMLSWIIIATVAAVGNAGVPMGCYFLASAFLASMQVPLYLLGAILPVYSLIDMLETALNVWSDVCVTTIVDKEL